MKHFLGDKTCYLDHNTHTYTNTVGELNSEKKLVTTIYQGSGRIQPQNWEENKYIMADMNEKLIFGQFNSFVQRKLDQDTKLSEIQ